MSRGLSKIVQQSPRLEMFRQLYERAESERWSRWSQAADAFLTAMWAFDRLIAQGTATQGENQNGKGDFFGDLVCLLLSNCSGKDLVSRPATAGRVFQNHALDASYPKAGTLEVLVETKACGAPISPRNSGSQKHPLGRPGSADLDKRIKEAALKTIDLKAEWARQQGAGKGPTGDLIGWLKSSQPDCFTLLAVRVVDEADTQRTIRISQAAQELSDGCGLFAYRPLEAGYEAVPIPRAMDMDIVVSRICERLRAAH